MSSNVKSGNNASDNAESGKNASGNSASGNNASGNNASGNGATRRPGAMFWVTPAIGLVIGVAYLVGAWAGGHPGLGVTMFGIMVVFSAGVALAGRRSETVRGLLDHRDERITAIDLRATAATGIVLILAILGGVVVQLARGQSGAPYTWLGVVAAVTYLAVLVVQRVRG